MTTCEHVSKRELGKESERERDIYMYMYSTRKKGFVQCN